MALRGKRINIFFQIMVPSGFLSGGHLSFINSFQKSNICWPQQPLTEIQPDISSSMSQAGGQVGAAASPDF